MRWEEIYKRKLVTPEEAVKGIKSGDCVFYSIGTCAPVDLVNAPEPTAAGIRSYNICQRLRGVPF